MGNVLASEDDDGRGRLRKVRGSCQTNVDPGANKKEQSALRAVIKCVEDHKLEAEFPLEDLRTRLEELEKAKTEKKAVSSCSSGGSSGPASKRIRASNGGAMPPAKAGCMSDNTGAPSSPATTTTFIGSPSSHASYGAGSPYSYDRPAGHTLYCGQSSLPMTYPPVVPNVGIAVSYPPPPMTYPVYAGYNSGLGVYGNSMAPPFHQAYYR
jgi:hypothetical protein